MLEIDCIATVFRFAMNGMNGDHTPTVGVVAAGEKVLLEMAYKPAVTSLMQLAGKAGWITVPGLEALVGQGVHQFKLWTDIMPLYGVSRDAVMGVKS